MAYYPVHQATMPGEHVTFVVRWREVFDAIWQIAGREGGLTSWPEGRLVGQSTRLADRSRQGQRLRVSLTESQTRRVVPASRSLAKLRGLEGLGEEVDVGRLRATTVVTLWVPRTVSLAADLIFADVCRFTNFGFWLREHSRLRHCQYSCHYDSVI